MSRSRRNADSRLLGKPTMTVDDIAKRAAEEALQLFKLLATLRLTPERDMWPRVGHSPHDARHVPVVYSRSLDLPCSVAAARQQHRLPRAGRHLPFKLRHGCRNPDLFQHRAFRHGVAGAAVLKPDATFSGICSSPTPPAPAGSPP